MPAPSHGRGKRPAHQPEIRMSRRFLILGSVLLFSAPAAAHGQASSTRRGAAPESVTEVARAPNWFRYTPDMYPRT